MSKTDADRLEREFTRFKTWAHLERGAMPKEKLLEWWQVWKAAKLIDELKVKRKAEPLTFPDGSDFQLNTTFADWEGGDTK